MSPVMTKPLRQRLKDLRLAAKLSQRELCRRMGVDESYVTRLESGERSPSPKVLSQWAEACGAELALVDPSSGIGGLIAGLRLDDIDRVRRYAEAIARLPEMPAGAGHPGDIAIAVVEIAAGAPART